MMSKTVPIHDNVFDVLFDVVFGVIFYVILYHVFDDFFHVVFDIIFEVKFFNRDMNSSQETLKDGFACPKCCWNATKRNHFRIGLLLVMKNGSITTTPSAKNHM